MNACEACGAPLPPRNPGPGRKRRFCNATCRKAAFRDLSRFGPIVDGLPDPVDGAALHAMTSEAVARVLEDAEPADAVGQLCRAVSETEVLAVEFRRLSSSTPRNLAWRSAGMSDHLRAGLDRLFPREDTP